MTLHEREGVPKFERVEHSFGENSSTATPVEDTLNLLLLSTSTVIELQLSASIRVLRQGAPLESEIDSRPR